MKVPLLETKRLLLRTYQPQDLAFFQAMLSKRQVIRYLIHTEPWPGERVEKWLQKSAAGWAEHDYGWWVLEHKGESQPIGWCGLNHLPETGEVEVLYALDQPYWGQGLATEAARFSVSYGFKHARLEAIIGLVVPGNLASARVLQKSGLTYTGQAPYFGHDLERYLVRRDSVNP